MNDPRPAPRARRPYSSPAMTERRQRVIDRAHAILGEGGVQSLTIERLSREADVAPRTLYRLFGDKEGVILATVSERLREVREHLARRAGDYSIEVVFDELDWMVSEMRRDAKYARVVIGFFFAADPRATAIRELGSVAYNRFRNWLDREIRAGHCHARLDLERIAQEHVATEYVVYHRWAVDGDDARCRRELRSNFLKNAVLTLTEPTRGTYLDLLIEHQRALGNSELGARPSGNRAARDAGEDFFGRA
jgi:AcrR family transcriptional regulator